MDKANLRKTREKLGLERSKAEEMWLRTHLEEPLPPYTGQLDAPAVRYPLAGKDHLAAGLAALVALVVYVRTLGPTVTGEDSGELITAAYTLGVAHPPGYPLWTLLAKLFAFIPHGTIAWRVNLMSAVFGAASVHVATLVGLKLGMRRWAAVSGALAFAFLSEY